MGMDVYVSSIVGVHISHVPGGVIARECGMWKCMERGGGRRLPAFARQMGVDIDCQKTTHRNVFVSVAISKEEHPPGTFLRGMAWMFVTGERFCSVALFHRGYFGYIYRIYIIFFFVDILTTSSSICCRLHIV